MSKAREEKARIKAQGKKAKLKVRIAALMSEYGDYGKVAEVLNSEGILTTQGKPWTPANVGSFLRRSAIPTENATEGLPGATIADQEAFISESASAPSALPEATSEPSLAEMVDQAIATSGLPAVTNEELIQLPPDPDELPRAKEMSPELVNILVDLHESGDLQALIKWWQSAGGKGATLVAEQRPILQGPAAKRKNTGILVDQDILDHAARKALEERARTGGSLSQLVELLLWQYIGSPGEFIKGV